MSEPILNRGDANSASWMKLKKHIEGRIEQLRIKNDGELDAVGTAKVRGRIAELKELLNAVEPKVLKTEQEEKPHSLEDKLEARRRL